MRITSPTTIIFLSILSLPALGAGLEERVRSCAAIAGAEERLSCYDAIGRGVIAETIPVEGQADAPPTDKAAVEGAVASTAAPASVKPADEHMGGYKFKDPERDPDEMAMVTRVIECQKERGSGSWYFRFQNQQVWKQVDRRTLNFQGCDFPVKVVSDGFGYVMRIEGREGKIRVSRKQ